MAPTHTAGPSGSAASPRPFACLVVEDHTLVAQLLTAALRVMPGIGSVTTASTVAAAVAAVADREFDLVILDLTLPDGHGLAVLRACAARHPRSACIVLSSTADEFTWQRKTGKKFYAYVTSDDGAVQSNRVIIPAN